MAYTDLILATDGLVAFWPFDEPSGSTAADAFGSADLAVAGGVTLGGEPLTAGGAGSFTFARPGSGRAWRGSSYPEAGVSIEGWFRCDDLTTVRQVLWMNGSGA